jgi:rare lipoprotein A
MNSQKAACWGKGTFVLLLLLFTVGLMACSQADPTQPPDQDEPVAETQEPVVSTEEGMATHYSQDQDGAKTANGETYRNAALTAAHKTLAFGTRVKVTNLENGKSVIAVINDRGPYAEGLIIDLSYSAAQALDMIESGTVRIKVEVLE